MNKISFVDEFSSWLLNLVGKLFLVVFVGFLWFMVDFAVFGIFVFFLAFSGFWFLVVLWFIVIFGSF